MNDGSRQISSGSHWFAWTSQKARDVGGTPGVQSQLYVSGANGLQQHVVTSPMMQSSFTAAGGRQSGRDSADTSAGAQLLCHPMFWQAGKELELDVAAFKSCGDRHWRPPKSGLLKLSAFSSDGRRSRKEHSPSRCRQPVPLRCRRSSEYQQSSCPSHRPQISD